MSFPRAQIPPDVAIELQALSVTDLEEIGVGNFSTVYKHRDYAIKQVSKGRVRRLNKETDVLMEKHALMRLSHNNIIKLFHTWTDSEYCYIATELCLDGELWDSCRRCGEPELRAKVFFIQIIDALQFIHRTGIVHRDLKAENIFLGHNGTIAKIGDFGSARDLFNPHVSGAGNSTVSIAGRSSYAFQHFVGSANFLSPEALENKENDELSDIWSLGCMIYQVLVGIPPFCAGSEYLVYLRIRADDLTFPPCGISETAVDLVKSIIIRDRHSRPSLPEILRHDFFTLTPSVLPLLTPDEIQIKRIAQSDLVDTAPHNAGVQFASQYSRDRLDMTRIVREWELKSQPGSGTSMLDHLDLCGTSLGKSDIHDNSNSDSEIS